MKYATASLVAVSLVGLLAAPAAASVPPPVERLRTLDGGMGPDQVAEQLDCGRFSHAYRSAEDDPETETYECAVGGFVRRLHVSFVDDKLSHLEIAWAGGKTAVHAREILKSRLEAISSTGKVRLGFGGHMESYYSHAALSYAMKHLGEYEEGEKPDRPHGIPITIPHTSPPFAGASGRLHLGPGGYTLLMRIRIR